MKVRVPDAGTRFGRMRGRPHRERRRLCLKLMERGYAGP